jgi:four helix bundle protein
MVQSFRELQVWQKAMDLADAVYTVTAEFPRQEIFGLTSQLRRAAVSIVSNVAEGRAIGGGRFLHHLRFALGSEAELETQMELAVRRSYISADRAQVIIANASEVRRMLHAMHHALKTRRIAGLTMLLMLGYAATLWA